MRGKKATLPSKLGLRVFPHHIAAVPRRASPKGSLRLRGALLGSALPKAFSPPVEKVAFRPKGEKTDEGAFVNIHHLIRRSAPPSPQ